ncbi:putative GTP-binding protein 6 isoform X1 [Psammomys obesus]|uniref:putative GTP-binding protein 6 isoform X1 n=2 Tax=Psammomys obesus TaxID=48139 RepID=UPI0024536667|nr:putative GTP-binding protein 6 isoform X1 [Psammomys obesus]
MQPLRAALLPGLRLLRGRRVLTAQSRAQTPPPWPVRDVSGGLRGPGSAWTGFVRAHGEGQPTEHGEEEEELLDAEPPLPLLSSAHRVCILHPDVKGPAARTMRSTAENDVAEAASLVCTLPGWSVARTLVVPTRVPDSKMVFGKGNFRDVTEKIRGSQDITCVFLNVERMSVQTKTALEASWGVPVLDRFTVVLHVFRCNARTREARLQLALAEIPLLRSTLSTRTTTQNQPGQGSRYIMGSGVSATELRQRALRDREARIRQALARLRDKRDLLRKLRTKREFPVVSVVGYTNSGKTTLIKALTGDAALQPRDQLFATLDVTAHAGWLPSRVPVLYMDTVGFLSRLPHGLMQAFSATLGDVAHSDVVVHVRDVAHPDTELQKETVLSTLQGLRLPPALLDTVLEVHNKVDLVPGYQPTVSGALTVSATSGLGLDELKEALEGLVLQATGRTVVTLQVPLGGVELSWLYAEATVQQLEEMPDECTAQLTVIISQAALCRFRKLFPGVL